jgi:hypothetical protein
MAGTVDKPSKHPPTTTSTTPPPYPPPGASVAPVAVNPADLEALKAKHWDEYGHARPFLGLANSTERGAIVIAWAQALLNAMSPALAAGYFWPVVRSEWASFDLIDHAAFGRLFGQMAAFRPGSLRSTLPRTRITIYRGSDASTPLGLSWTSNPDVAAAFARGHRGIHNAQPTIWVMRALPEQICFVDNNRNEAEVVLIGIPSKKMLQGTSNGSAADAR